MEKNTRSCNLVYAYSNFLLGKINSFNRFNFPLWILHLFITMLLLLQILYWIGKTLNHKIEYSKSFFLTMSLQSITSFNKEYKVNIKDQDIIVNKMWGTQIYYIIKFESTRLLSYSLCIVVSRKFAWSYIRILVKFTLFVNGFCLFKP